MNNYHYVVQIYGKVRGRFDLSKDETQENIMKAALDHTLIKTYVDGKKVEKVIFVPNKLLNIVTREN